MQYNIHRDQSETVDLHAEKHIVKWKDELKISKKKKAKTEKEWWKEENWEKNERKRSEEMEFTSQKCEEIEIWLGIQIPFSPRARERERGRERFVY